MIALKRIEEITPTEPMPEQKPELVYHHRLKCSVCGSISQPSALERALWFEARICPKCVSGEERRSHCYYEWDHALFEEDRRLQLEICDMEEKLKAANDTHAALLREAHNHTDLFGWLSKRRIEDIEYYLMIDVEF